MKKLNSFLSLLLTATLILSTPLTTFAAEPIDDEILIESSDSDNLLIEDAITEETTDVSSASSIEANSVPDADISEPEPEPDATVEEISNDTCASSDPDENVLYQDELLTVYASDNDETETEEPVSSVSSESPTSDIISCDRLGEAVSMPKDEEEIYNRLMELKRTKYPTGTPWGITKTWEGSVIYGDFKSITSGKACAAFALTVQDEIFGNAPKYMTTYRGDKRPTYDDLHVGDYIGMQNHARILVEKTPTQLTWVGGNEGPDYANQGDYDNGVVYWDYDCRTKHNIPSHVKDWDNPEYVLANLDKIITCSPHTFTCSFDTLGGPAVNSVTSDYYGNVTLPTPKWSGHTFNGWYPKKDQAENPLVYEHKKIKPGNYNIYQDMTLYASWKEGGSTPEPAQPKLTSLDVGATNINMEKDSKQNIRISALPANADVTIEWSLPYGPSNIIHCEQDKTVVGQNQMGLIVHSFDKADVEVIRVTATDNNYGNKITKDINVEILEQIQPVSETCFVGEKINISKRFLDGQSGYMYFIQGGKNDAIGTIDNTGNLTTKKAGTTSIVVKEKYTGQYCTEINLTILPKPVIKFTQAMTYKNQERNIYDCITNISAATLGDARFTRFASSKTAVASISNEGIITAKTPGTTSITAYIAESGKDGAMKTVTVKASLSVKIPTFAKTSYTMKAGQTLKIAMKNVTAATNAEYTSSDPDLINVSADINAKNGKKTGKIAITAIAYTPPGVTQTVIATIDGQTYTVPVYVVEPALKTSPMTHQLSKSIKVGKTLTVALKNTAFKTADVTWISEDPSIASVTGNKVKGIKAGTTKVYTTAGGIRNEYTVTVY